MSRLTPARLHQIEAAANEAIDGIRRCRELSAVRSLSEFEQLPIDPHAAAIQLGLRIEESEEFSREDIRGALVGDRMIVRSRFSPDARFTVAHEVGHRVLHGVGIHLRQKCGGQHEPEPRPEVELEADVFAVNFLMPKKLVRAAYSRYFGELLDGRYSVEDTAHFLKVQVSDFVRMTLHERAKIVVNATSFGGLQFRSLVDLFGVSVEAMAIRLVELRLIS